jgi:hypothetical protein
VNKITAAQMVPFDSIKFTGNYGNMTEISYQTRSARRRKGRTTTSPASGRNVVATSPSAPTCTNNAHWQKGGACRLFVFSSAAIACTQDTP